MNHEQQTKMQQAFRAMHARRKGEACNFWRARLDWASKDIYATLALHPHDSEYAKRLYLELDEVRAAQLAASKVAA